MKHFNKEEIIENTIDFLEDKGFDEDDIEDLVEKKVNDIFDDDDGEENLAEILAGHIADELEN
jgi:hypothetical protein